TNIRNVTEENLDEKINFFSVDVSFISLKHIFPVAYAISTDDVIGACLVKPQFEAGKEKVGKKGVVRDSAVHKEVIVNVMDYANQNGFFVKELTFSPIKGPEGNIEFLIVITKNEQDNLIGEEQVDMVVNEAKKHLGE
ncbi:MAG: TlyA family RNA methyltransferase, partial [Oscillospiraceae bacterium]|nr:TlyA family RNA methyltransferase [Oscillospiraceae bacterium]